MRRLPPLNALRAFEAAARLSSVTAAGAELNVSHSAISQQIRQLEDYFGLKLFTRPGRRVEPTEAAQAYFEDVRAALDRLAVASAQLADRGAQQFITLNATPSFALRWLIPRTAAFQIDNPDIQLRIATSASDGVSHLDQPFDFIFRREPMAREGRLCRRLLDDVSTPVAAPSAAARRPIAAPAQLLDHPLLHLRSRPGAWKQWFAANEVSVPDALAGAFHDNFFLALEAAVNGLGVALAPGILVEEDIRGGRLVAPFPDRTISGPGFHVLFAADAARSRPARTFLRWLEAATGAELV